VTSSERRNGWGCDAKKSTEVLISHVVQDSFPWKLNPFSFFKMGVEEGMRKRQREFRGKRICGKRQKFGVEKKKKKKKKRRLNTFVNFLNSSYI